MHIYLRYGNIVPLQTSLTIFVIVSVRSKTKTTIEKAEIYRLSPSRQPSLSETRKSLPMVDHHKYGARDKAGYRQIPCFFINLITGVSKSND